MKEIQLTQGLVALVDDEDFEHLNQYKWHAHQHGRTFYARRNETCGKGRQRTVRMHTLLMNTPKGMHTDHINGNGLDNRRCNLHKAVACSSRYRGVCWNKLQQQWVAYISVEGKRLNLGVFDCEFVAAAAYDVAGFARDPEHFTPNFSASFLAPVQL